MKLIPVKNNDGEMYYINPSHIVSISKSDHCAIIVMVNSRVYRSCQNFNDFMTLLNKI